MTYIGGVVTPLSVGFKGLFVDCPQEGAQVAELHHHHNDCVMALQS